MVRAGEGLLGRRGRLAVGLLLVVAVATLFVAWRDTAVFASLEGQALDWRFRLRGPQAPGGNVVIVALDDRTLEAIGPWPVPHDRLAALLLALGRGGARVVAVDLLLSGDSADAAPAEKSLPAALSVIGKSVIAFAFTAPVRGTGAAASSALAANAYRIAHEPAARTAAPAWPTGVVAPGDTLLAVAAAGHVNVELDADGALRRALPVIDFNGLAYPALPVVATRLWGNVGADGIVVTYGKGIAVGDTAIPTDARMRQVVDYYGPAGSFARYSAIDVLEDRVPPGTFRDRLVIVGATATGVGDTFATPFSPLMPGVEYFATVADNILQQRFLVRDEATRVLDLAVIVLLGVAAAVAGALLRPFVGLLVMVLLAALSVAGNFMAFARAGLWLDATFPLLALLALALWAAASGASYEGRMRLAAERRGTTLARFVSPMAERTAARPDEALREAAVLFVDIRGFTALAEAMAPADAMALLRRFHAVVDETVQRHHGVIDKFIGDGAMAVFGLDRPGPAAAADALACAIALVRGRGGLQPADATADNVPTFRIGVGVHFGPVEVGEVGGTARAEVTIGGDTVNVASRLEALTRTHGVDVIASDAACAAARTVDGAAMPAGFVALPEQAIRGRRSAVRVLAWSAPPADD